MAAMSAGDDLRLFALPDGAAPAVAGPPRRRRARRRPPPNLLAVDGNGLAHRAFHAIGGVEAEPGEAGHRFLAMLARIGAAIRPTGCVIGFDDPLRSLRRERFPGYKAARPPKEDALVEWLDGLPGLVRDIGLAVSLPEGLEADDVLGSAASLATRHTVAAALATGDQDAFALVSPTVQVWLLGGGGRLQQVSPSWLRARYGVGPGQYPAFAALRGDSSDCLPGVRGIGAVTAARLLEAYPDVEAAMADPGGVARLFGTWVAEALLTHRQTYELNRELMAIHTDVPLDVAACNRPLEPTTVSAALHERGLDHLTPSLLGGFSLLGKAAWRRPPPQPAAPRPAPSR